MEILSEGNTEAEMNRKLRDYFQAGVRVVWYIEPKTRAAYTTASEWTEIGQTVLFSVAKYCRDSIAARPVAGSRRRAERRVTASDTIGSAIQR